MSKLDYHWRDADSIDEIELEVDAGTGKFTLTAGAWRTMTDHAARRAMSIDQLRRTRGLVDQAIAFLEQQQTAAETVTATGAAL